MSQQYRNRPIQVDRLFGGETSRHGLHGMRPGMSHKLENCYNTENETVKKMPGFVPAQTAGEGYMASGYEFIMIDGTKHLFFAAATGATSVYELIGTTMVTVSSTPFTGSEKPSFVSMNNKCYMVCGDGVLYEYDGVATFFGIVGGAGIPAEAFKLHVYKDRMWAIDKADRMTVLCSADGDPSDWTTVDNAGSANFTSILGEGDELLDMATFVNYIVFFFRNHILIYSGAAPIPSGEWTLVQQIDRTGVTQTGVIQPVGTDLWYVHDTGIKSLRQVVTTGAVNVRDVSEVIDETLVPTIVAATRRGSIHYPARKWVMFLADDFIWIYDYGIKAWSHIKFDTVGIPSRQVHDMMITSEGIVYFMGGEELLRFDVGFHWKYTAISDIAIEMEWNTANIIIAAKGNNTFPSMLELHIVPVTLASGTITVSWEFDHNGHVYTYPHAIEVQQIIGVLDIDGVTDWDAIDPLDGYLQEHIYVPLEGEGKTMDITIKHSFAAGVEFEAFVIERIEGGT